MNKVTIIDPIGRSSIGSPIKKELYKLLGPKTKQSLMKNGGDFPYLSNHEEYNMLLIVHYH